MVTQIVGKGLSLEGKTGQCDFKASNFSEDTSLFLKASLV